MDEYINMPLNVQIERTNKETKREAIETTDDKMNGLLMNIQINKGRLIQNTNIA